MEEPLLTTKAAAEIIGLSVAWFERKRWEGEGIPYVKLGRSVRYRRSDLEKYITDNIRQSTSDNGEPR